MEEGWRPRRGRVAALALVAACGAGKAPSRGPALGGALGAALAAADHARVPWRCAAPDLPALGAARLQTGPRRWQLAGHAVRRLDPDRELVIGVVADAADAAPPTLAALGRLRAKLAAADPDLVLALGGMGETPAALEATLGAFADHAAWPVVALPGDLEAVPAELEALAALRARGDAVIDGRLARWIELPGATIATVPGAGAAERLVAGDDGCAWRAGDVAALYAELGARPGLRIAATAEAPREVFAGEPTGERALVPAAPIDLVLHGPTRPAPSPARAGGRDRAGVALSPGTADATTRLPAIAAPSVGVLVIRGGAWRWRPLVDTR